jgi:hypothetical protein
MSDIKQILEKALPAKVADQYTEDFRACARLMLRGLLDSQQVATIRRIIAERIEDEVYVMGQAGKRGTP